VRSGFLGVVSARGGEARVFLRPEADSLSVAWSRIAAPLIQPADRIPEAALARLGVPGELLAVQAQVLQGPGWYGWPVARIGREPYPIQDLPNGGTPDDPFHIPYVNESGHDVNALLIGAAGTIQDGSLLIQADSAEAVSAPRDLQQRWDRFPFFQQLRDSVRAAGADFEGGRIRYALRGDTLEAYQPSYAVAPKGRTSLVLVNVAHGGRLGAGRTYDEAWRNLRGEVAPTPIGTEITSRLEQARDWLERADEALKRGDLQEFGRAFNFLRELLRQGGERTQGESPK
jgi:hypothetical protein